MARRLLVSLLLGQLTFSQLAYGFGDVGHLTICEMAYGLLSPKAKSEVDQITNNAPFAQQCIWPDQVKRSHPFSSMSVYHYINMDEEHPWQPSDLVIKRDRQTGQETRTRVPEHGDMIQMLLRSQDKIQALSTETDRKQKLCYLRYLGHLTGDSHQPLHYGRSRDQGANAIKVKYNGMQFYPFRSLALQLDQQSCAQRIFEPPFECMISKTIMVERRNQNGESGRGMLEVNLHAVWDDNLIDHQLLKLGIAKPANFETRDVFEMFKAFSLFISNAAQPKSAELNHLRYDHVMQYMDDSVEHLALAYNIENIEQTESFYEARIGIVNDLIQRAAVRLAGFLNATFDPTHFAVPEATQLRNRQRRDAVNRLIEAGRETEFRTTCDDI